MGMKKAFEVGDKIRVYDGFGGRDGEISHFDSQGLIYLVGKLGVFHPKQCRALKRAAPKTTVFINVYKDPSGVQIIGSQTQRTLEAAKGNIGPAGYQYTAECQEIKRHK